MTTDIISRTEQTAVRIRLVNADISADISLPRDRRGLVVFAGGAGSGSCSPVTRRLAEILNETGFATLIADLILENEQVLNERTGSVCDGLDLLAQRLVAITDWVAMQDGLKELPVGLFGLGIGAAAALIASTKRFEVRAVVACGGRLSEVECFVAQVPAAALFVAGYEDIELLGQQRNAIARLEYSTPRHLETIGWTTDPLQDPHAVDRVALLARRWFEAHLSRPADTGAEKFWPLDRAAAAR